MTKTFRQGHSGKRGHFAAPAADGYSFDANGNVVQRPGQELTWDAENHLAQVAWGSPLRTESYQYDESGVRVRKTEGSANTYYPFPHYEVRQTGATKVVTKYYYFGGMLIAKSEGGVRTHLHTDQLGSVVLETNSVGGLVHDQRYFAYGRRLDASGDTSGERDFTGQQLDATGLLYYNARYYDPTLGQFISPDTIVPDPNQFLDYNRYLYSRGNPLKYNDPSGHCATNEDGSRSEADAECWSYVDIIVRHWNEDPDYWNQLFGTQDTWLEHLATHEYFDKDWMFGQYETYLKSDSFRQAESQRQAERALLPPKNRNYGPGPCDPGMWDCKALGLDVASLGLSAVQTAGVVCTSFTGPVCGAIGWSATGADAIVTVESMKYTVEQYARGEASDLDISIATGTTSMSLVPGTGIVTDFVALGWDAIDPFIPDEEWWGPKGAQ